MPKSMPTSRVAKSYRRVVLVKRETTCSDGSSVVSWVPCVKQQQQWVLPLNLFFFFFFCFFPLCSVFQRFYIPPLLPCVQCCVTTVSPPGVFGRRKSRHPLQTFFFFFYSLHHVQVYPLSFQVIWSLYLIKCTFFIPFNLANVLQAKNLCFFVCVSVAE